MQQLRSSTIARGLVLSALMLATMSGTALAAGVTTQFDLAGVLVNSPRTFDYNALNTFPSPNPITQVDSFTAGGVPTTTTFTGVPLYSLLTDPAGGGGIVTTPGVKNDFLGD